MKKVFAFSLVLIMMLAVCCAPIGAAEAAGVDIWVNIINGGTAVIITEVNCPLPDKSRITLEDGQSEAFHIDFTEEGTYSYLVEIEPDERELTFDDTVYNVKVLVSEDNGKLYTSILIYNTKSGNKYAPQGGGDDPCTITFSNSTEPPAPRTFLQTDRRFRRRAPRTAPPQVPRDPLRPPRPSPSPLPTRLKPLLTPQRATKESLRPIPTAATIPLSRIKTAALHPADRQSLRQATIPDSISICCSRSLLRRDCSCCRYSTTVR